MCSYSICQHCNVHFIPISCTKAEPNLAFSSPTTNKGTICKSYTRQEYFEHQIILHSTFTRNKFKSQFVSIEYYDL